MSNHNEPQVTDLHWEPPARRGLPPLQTTELLQKQLADLLTTDA